MKKGGKLPYGYKRHYLAQVYEGLVVAVHTTSASVHDSQYLGTTLRKVRLTKGSRVLADKNLLCQIQWALFRSKGLRSGLQHKAYRHRPLTNTEKRYNKLVGKLPNSARVGSIKHWFGSLEALGMWSS